MWNQRARFHAEKHLGAMSYAPQLPPQGCERKADFVVHSKSDADIWLQFPSPIYNHHLEVLSELTEEKLEKLQGSVDRPKLGIMYLAPHLRSDGSYYKAEVINSADYLTTEKSRG